ncbi:MAG: hypothetical protein IKF52_05025 [Clostridia bacterium]|nr:hypothetical protein [Clostridia bacterium]
MKIEEGHLLKFIPPILDGNSYGNKKRYMLVINCDNENNTIEMINVSSIKGKEHKLLYDSNIEIKNYNPLPVPTFAKLDTLYTIDNFSDLQKFMSFNGTKISNSEISNIKLQRYNYIKNCNPTNVINYSETDFKKTNFIKI